MLRSTSQSRAAARLSGEVRDRTYLVDGVEWRFWSLAPGRADRHWVTDGHDFALADSAGLVSEEVHRVRNRLSDLQGAVAEGSLRMADDEFNGRGYDTPGCLVMPQTRLGSPRARVAALEEHSLGGRRVRTVAEILAGMRSRQ